MILSLFFFFLSGIQSQAQTLIAENERAHFTESQYTLLVHTDDLSDPFRVTSEGLLELLGKSLQNKTPLIELVPPERLEWAQRNLSSSDYLVISSAGQHGLSFAPGATLYIAGGNLSLCLCETLRDLIASAQGDLNLVLYSPAIYDFDAYWMGVGMGLSKTTLGHLLTREDLAREQFLIKFFENIFGYGGVGKHALCPLQNIYSAPELNIGNYNLELYLKDQSYKFSNPSKRSAPRIRIFFK